MRYSPYKLKKQPGKMKTDNIRWELSGTTFFIGRKTYSQSQQKCHSLWKQRSRLDIKLLTNFPLQLAGYSCKNHDQRKFRLQCIHYSINTYFQNLQKCHICLRMRFHLATESLTNFPW